MSGVKIIRALLVQSSALVALVPDSASRICAGVLAQGTTLPAIALTDVVGMDRNILAPGFTHHVTDRVQVTVITQTYAQQKQLLALVRSACRDKIGLIAGVQGVTVHTESKGPDFNDPAAGFYMQTQDFRVEYQEAA